MWTFLFLSIMTFQSNPESQPANENAIDYAQAFLLEVKKGNNTDHLEKILKDYDYSKLKKLLSDDEKKKSFWINIYNGFVQKELKDSPEKYKKRNQFFKSEFIEIAGKKFSLDDIEHGILRRSKIKISWGYLNKLFPGKTEKELRVDEVDPRIHFALNCGATSCPPIAFYNPQHIEEQLDLATQNYLSNNVKVEDNTLYASKLFSWFRGDFGGKKGIKKFIIKFKDKAKDQKYKLRFTDYDWQMELDRYVVD